MRSPSIRPVILLRLTFVGTSADIRRDVIVDRDLSLAELRDVVLTVFDGPACGHHLFADSLDGSRWSRERRRWGDRWTMIDFRDPTVIDETTARIGRVLHGREPIYFAHTCDGGWVVEIEAGPDDVVAASDPRVRIVGGERRSLFACSRGPYEHDVLVGVLDDPHHPDHNTLRARLELTVGPWATFDPEVFDLDATRRSLDAQPTRARTSPDRLLESLMRKLPVTAHAGLRAHVAAAGLELPVVVTADEAALMTREFRWVVERASDGGIPFADGGIDSATILAGVEALECDEDRMRRLISVSRRLRFVYSRNGQLIAKKSVCAAASAPTTLWTALADAVSSSSLGSDAPAARDLFLLAIADGSLAAPGIGIGSVAKAFSLADRWRRDSWNHSLSYSQNHSWIDQGGPDPDCAQRCDCPSVDGATWHDIVAKSIRDAAASAASDGAVTVAARENYRDAGIRIEWVPDEMAPTRVDTREYDGDDCTLDAAASDLLRAVAGLVDMLSLFGLGRSDDGAWIVPATLREFARAALQRQRRYADF